MKLTDIKTNLSIEAEISEVESSDFRSIIKSKEFEFDWKKEKVDNEVFKLYVTVENEEILGLISIKDIEKEFRIHINLIEVSKSNIGKGKRYDRIAGNLIAFACELAFDKSYGGFVSLIPKTRLVDHYCAQYGFQQFGRQLALDYEESLAIIRKYS